MRGVIFRLFDDCAADLSVKIAALYGLLISGNLAAWLWALVVCRHYPLLLGAAVIAYGLGLRHAVDADHIAAIDSVTRKLMQERKRPVAAGFFFALGHSTIVFLATLAIAATATAFRDRLDVMHSVGGAVGTAISTLFLLMIAAVNLAILARLYRNFRAVQAGCADPAVFGDAVFGDTAPTGNGLAARVLRSMFGLIRRSWHMYPLGFLFGLGFDTATEIGLLGLSATQAAQGLPVWSILVFPALFAAGMSLVDTTDGILMLNAYGWAFVKPVRKLYYNMTITFLSAAVAVLVGGIEALGLAEAHFGLAGGFWRAIGALNENFGALGYAIIAVFMLTWIVAAARYRLRERST
jgi:high-affinity nickel-transport protein